jgi:hypothetical protein
LEVERVAGHRFLFEIANDPVRGAGGDQIQDRESGEEHGLDTEDHHALEPCRPRDLDECHQMHPLVLGFLYQRPDPAFVITHPSQAAQVGEHRTDHARHGRHGFQDDGPMAVPLGEKRVGTEPQQFGEAKREPVGKAFRRMVHDRLGFALDRQGARIGGEYRIDHLDVLSSWVSPNGASSARICAPGRRIGSLCWSASVAAKRR